MKAEPQSFERSTVIGEVTVPAYPYAGRFDGVCWCRRTFIPRRGGREIQRTGLTYLPVVDEVPYADIPARIC